MVELNAAKVVVKHDHFVGTVGLLNPLRGSADKSLPQSRRQPLGEYKFTTVR